MEGINNIVITDKNNDKSNIFVEQNFIDLEDKKLSEVVEFIKKEKIIKGIKNIHKMSNCAINMEDSLYEILNTKHNNRPLFRIIENLDIKFADIEDTDKFSDTLNTCTNLKNLYIDGTESYIIEHLSKKPIIKQLNILGIYIHKEDQIEEPEYMLNRYILTLQKATSLTELIIYEKKSDCEILKAFLNLNSNKLKLPNITSVEFNGNKSADLNNYEIIYQKLLNNFPNLQNLSIQGKRIIKRAINQANPFINF